MLTEQTAAAATRSAAPAELGSALLGELFRRVTDALLVLDSNDRVIAANPAAEELLAVSQGDLLGLEPGDLFPVGSPLLAFLSAPDRNGPLELEIDLALPRGGVVTTRVSAVRYPDGRTALLCRPAEAPSQPETDASKPALSTSALLDASPAITLVLDEHGRFSYLSASAALWGLTGTDLLEGDLWRAMHPRDRDEAMAALATLRPRNTRSGDSSRNSPGSSAERSASCSATVTVRFRYVGRWYWFELHAVDLHDHPQVRGLMVQARDVDAQVRQTASLNASEAYYRTLFERSQEGVVLIGRNRRSVRFGGAAAGLLGLGREKLTMSFDLERMHPDDVDALTEALDMIEARAGASESVRFRHQGNDGEYNWFEGTLTNLLDEPSVAAFLLNFREIRGQVEALRRNENLNEELRRRLAHLQSLRRIDMAINNSVDMRLVLDIFTSQLLQDLDIDAAAVLLYEPALHVLRPNMGRGFTVELRHRFAQRLGEGPAGRAAAEQRQVYIADLQGDEGWGAAIEPEHQQSYTSYMAVPMVAKGQLQGVIELYSSQPIGASEEWLEFLETYADQGAIAIENSQLIRSLERSNTELQRAYDRTIEGWANALDLKDEETAGHSKRVTDMTVRLARLLGVPHDEMVHLQRGALLHDIGKMGIPDQILLKRGPLTTEEFDVMKQHPVYAHELLSPIEFLRPALHIPYCHHEKWDGSGYPRQLKGEQIPLAARIFAVVDVYDALTSERPYREAWSVDRAKAYIRDGSGSHFDPDVVTAFFKLVEDDG